jgi:hypothetical protein
MDSMTQQNAAMVEEAAAVAVNLRDQAARLAQAVGFFDVAGQAGERADDGLPPPPTLPPARALPAARSSRRALTAA